MEYLLLQSSQDTPLHIQPPINWAGHMPFAFWLTDAAKPDIFVELGTHTANSYFAFCQSVQRHHLSTHCYAVDSWQGDEHAGYYGDEVYQNVAEYNQKHYGTFSSLMRMTFDEAHPFFPDKAIDLLHIDGMHTYEAVRHDFDTWLPKMSEKGIVLFHDIAVRERGFGVWKLWDELSAIYPNMYFDHSYGLGVLFTGAVQPPTIRALLQEWSSADSRAFLKHFFAVSGEHIALNYTPSQMQELESRVMTLGEQLQARDSRIMSLSAELQERDARINTLTGDYNRVVGSGIWRIMKPIRKISNSLHKRVKKIRHLLLRPAGVPPYPVPVIPFTQPGVPGPVPPQDRNDYAAWIEHYDTLDAEKQQFISDEIRNMDSQPKISIIMVVTDTAPAFLDQAIRSVRNQLYPNWELCIVDDYTSNRRERRALIKKHAKEDRRIKRKFRRKKSNLSTAGNMALNLASGDYTALLDHDDQLAPDALYWITREIISFPGTVLLYSDEDRFDAANKRCAPYFKCDFDYTLFLSQNMTAHLSICKTDMIKAIGGFRSGFDGALEFDLSLRIIELIDVSLIRHIPKVLYHTRLHKKINPSAHSAALHALNEHFQRMKISAHAEPAPEAPGMNRVRYHLPAKPPSVEIIILTRDKPSLLKKCMESILEKTTYPNYSITLVDNGSEESETFDLFSTWERHPLISIIRDDAPFNFSRLNNAVVQHSTADVIALVNNDIEVITPDWLNEMTGHALQKNVGAVGARLWYPDETLQHGGVILGLGGLAGHANKNMKRGETGYCFRQALPQGLSAVTAACLVVQRDHYMSIGGFDEQHLSVAFNDVDFCLKLREKGLRNIWTPYAECYHHESASRGEDDTPEKQARIGNENAYMKERWAKEILDDPAYSRNLTIELENFTLAWPPRSAPQCGNNAG